MNSTWCSKLFLNSHRSKNSNMCFFCKIPCCNKNISLNHLQFVFNVTPVTLQIMPKFLFGSQLRLYQYKSIQNQVEHVVAFHKFLNWSVSVIRMNKNCSHHFLAMVVCSMPIVKPRPRWLSADERKYTGNW